MKQILLILLVAIGMSACAQIDTIILLSGRTLAGISTFYSDRLLLKQSNGENIMMMYGDIIRAEIYQSLYNDGSLSPHFTTNGTQLLAQQFKFRKYEVPDKDAHLTRAGNFGIASVVFTFGGILTSVIGAATKKPVLAYVGAGFSGVGVGLLLPAFINLQKAGRKKPALISP